MDGMPDGTLGFRVSGDVERSDYTDVMMPELQRRLSGAVACERCI
jgi:hypothetical protein